MERDSKCSQVEKVKVAVKAEPGKTKFASQPKSRPRCGKSRTQQKTKRLERSQEEKKRKQAPDKVYQEDVKKEQRNRSGVYGQRDQIWEGGSRG